MSNENLNTLVLEPKGLGCSNKDSGSINHSAVVGTDFGHYRTMRYTINIPAEYDPELMSGSNTVKEPITAIKRCKIQFTSNAHSFGVLSNEANIKDNIYCFFSKDPYWYSSSKETIIGQSGIKINYDPDNEKFPETNDEVINLQPNQTYYLFVYSKNTSHGNVYWGVEDKTYAKVTLYYESTTKCVTPVPSVNAEIQTLSLTVNLTGAVDGLHNPIEIYKYGYFASEQATPVLIENAEATVDSISLELDENNWRGKPLYFYIQAMGKTGQNGLVQGGILCTINSLPQAPQVQPEEIVIPSSGGLASFNVTEGGDKDQGQKLSIYYRKKDESTYYKYENGIDSNGTYYFYTYDGLEYSSGGTEVTVIKNSKPELSISAEGTPLKAYDKSGEITNYVIAPEVKADPISNTGQSTNQYKYYIRFSNSGEGNESQTTEWILMSGARGTGDTFKPEDVRNYLQKYSLPCYYQVGCIRNDGIEDSDLVSSEYWYYLTAPNFIEFINTKTVSNETSNVTYCGQNLRAKFYYDEGFSTAWIQGQAAAQFAQDNETYMLATLSLSENEGNSLREQKISSIILGNQETRFQYTYKIDEKKYQQIAKTVLSNLSIPSTIKPYTNDTDSYSCGWNINPDGPQNYGYFDGIDGKVFVRFGNNSGEGQLITVKKSGNDSTLNFTLAPTDLFTALPSALNYNGQNEVEFILQLINDFGDVAEVSKAFVADFNETGNIAYDNNTITYAGKPFDERNHLLEGMALGGSIDIKSYNPVEKVTMVCDNYVLWTQSLSPDVSNGTAPSPGNPLTYNLSFLGNLPAFDTDKVNSPIVIVVETKSGNGSVNLVEKSKIRGYRTPKISLVSAKYNSGKLTAQWRIDDVGYSEDIGQKTKIELFSEENGYLTEGFFSFQADIQGVTEATMDYNFGEYNFLHLAPVLYTRITDDAYILTKYTQSHDYQYLVVYNTVPTVAYRPNQLGINTLNPTNFPAAAVVVGAHTEKNLMIFSSDENTAILNLLNGELTGFIVDCGTWDLPTEEI